ncbi:hypothetical protein BDY21DRAFT_424935 [Lineolata rhizophorae]|uniref:LysM domain-containing protein n=1 Tax=Lineolata rhizophorae TaxID=578093 RepID=A0A6A6NMT4_9PEZI|nr:hypothetical protein BDY21DRAFT_424935 [Lineolata rhizophorae]
MSASAGASDASLRPRPRRHVSGPAPGAAADASARSAASSPSRAATPSQSRPLSRAASPMPAAHPSRGGAGGAAGGRSVSAGVGGGSTREREEMVRARKRADLLAGAVRDEVSEATDKAGRYKRRNSDLLRPDDLVGSGLSSSSVPPDVTRAAAEGDGGGGDALVYVHHVKRGDTMAGVCIRYGCNQTVLRKANRMWPNDTVQVRRTLVIPVDACTVKGRRVDGPHEHRGPEKKALDDNGDVAMMAQEEEDLLLAGGAGAEPSPSSPPRRPTTNGWHKGAAGSSSAPQDARPRSSSSMATNTTAAADPDPPWKHDSWVLLPADEPPVAADAPSSSSPPPLTEIARMPRRALGFFPTPARRKSASRASVSLEESSAASTPAPSSSLDLPRASLASDSAAASPTSSPLQRAQHHQHKHSHSTLSRASSSASSAAAATAATAHLSARLHGPGGVGTMGRNVRGPGPQGPDKFSRMLARHLPSVEPPPGVEAFTPWWTGAGGAAALEGGGAAAAGPGPAAGVGVAGALAELETLGGAVEGWVRRVVARDWGAAGSSGDGAGPAPAPARGRAPRAESGAPAAAEAAASLAGGRVARNAHAGPAVVRNPGVVGLGAGAGGGDLIELADAFEYMEATRAVVLVGGFRIMDVV